MSRHISRSRSRLLRLEGGVETKLRFLALYRDFSIVETKILKVSRFSRLSRPTFFQCQDRESRSRPRWDTSRPPCLEKCNVGFIGKYFCKKALCVSFWLIKHDWTYCIIFFILFYLLLVQWSKREQNWRSFSSAKQNKKHEKMESSKSNYERNKIDLLLLIKFTRWRTMTLQKFDDSKFNFCFCFVFDCWHNRHSKSVVFALLCQQSKTKQNKTKIKFCFLVIRQAIQKCS